MQGTDLGKYGSFAEQKGIVSFTRHYTHFFVKKCFSECKFDPLILKLKKIHVKGIRLSNMIGVLT